MAEDAGECECKCKFPVVPDGELKPLPDFSDWAPFTAMRVAAGEYEIRSKSAAATFEVEGRAFAEWIARSLNTRCSSEAVENRRIDLTAIAIAMGAWLKANPNTTPTIACFELMRRVESAWSVKIVDTQAEQDVESPAKIRRALVSTIDALRSYQYGNSEPELAQSVADSAEKILGELSEKIPASSDTIMDVEGALVKLRKLMEKS